MSELKLEEGPLESTDKPRYCTHCSRLTVMGVWRTIPGVLHRWLPVCSECYPHHLDLEEAKEYMRAKRARE